MALRLFPVDLFFFLLFGDDDAVPAADDNDSDDDSDDSDSLDEDDYDGSAGGRSHRGKDLDAMMVLAEKTGRPGAGGIFKGQSAGSASDASAVPEKQWGKQSARRRGKSLKQRQGSVLQNILAETNFAK